MIPKYALLEFERKFLVRELPEDLGEPTLIEDLYIEGTRLRLRKMTSPDGSVVYKLGKKYGAIRPGEEPIVNAYLEEAEYRVFAALPGAWLRKRRYRVDGFSLDVFDDGLAIAEVEGECGHTPLWIGDEVTGHSNYEGISIAGQKAGAT